MKQEKSIITFLRHGEPQGGVVFRVRQDDALTQKGWQQMYNAFEQLDCKNTIDIVFSSTLQRCSAFAKTIAAQYSLPLEEVNALQEINFGQWEGQSIEQIAAQNKNQLSRFWENPIENTPPDGEPVSVFQQRVISCWDNLVADQRGRNCLLLTHGGVQKMILAEVLNMSVQAIHNIEVPYACATVFHVYFSAEEVGPVITMKSHGCFM